MSVDDNPLQFLAGQYRDVLDGLANAGISAYPTTTGGNCAALEIAVPDSDHYVLITCASGVLAWSRSDHGGWMLGRYNVDGEPINSRFEPDYDAYTTLTDGSAAAVITAAGQILAWSPSRAAAQ